MALNLGEVTFRIGADATSLEKAGKSTAKFRKVVDKTSDSLEKGKKKTAAFSDKMTDLSKSVQVALGPLSGVAARLTAITALANRNTAAIAGVIGGFIAFATVAAKSVKAGSQVEKQLFQIQGRLKATGNAVGLTVKQLDELARSLGDRTLTSASEARKAILILLTATNLQGEQFERVLRITQDLASLGFGNLGRQAQRLARVIKDPLQNIETLKRVNISFNETEKRLIKTLKNTGREFELINLVLGKFIDIEGVAEDETKGLAGAMDSLREIVTNFLADAALTSGALKGLAQEIRNISEAFLQQAEATGALQKFGTTVRVMFVGVAKVLTAFLQNFRSIVILMTGFVAGRVLFSIAAGLVVLVRGLNAAAFATKALAAATALKALASFKSFLVIMGLLAAAVIILSEDTEAVGKVIEKVGNLAKSMGAKLGVAFNPKPLAELTKKIREANVALAVAGLAVPFATDKFNRFGLVVGGAGDSAERLEQPVFRLADKLGLLGSALKISVIQGKAFILEFVGPAGKQLEELNRILAKTRRLKEFNDLIKATRTPLEIFSDKLEELADIRNNAFILLAGDAERLEVALRGVARGARKAKKEFEDATDAGKLLKEAAVDFTTTIASGLEDAIAEGKALSDVFQSLEQDLIRLILRATFFKPLEEGLSAAFEGRKTQFGGDLAETARTFLISLGFGEDPTEETSPKQKALDKQTERFTTVLFKMLTSGEAFAGVIDQNLIPALGENITKTQLQSLASLTASTGLKDVAVEAFNAARALAVMAAQADPGGKGIIGGIASLFEGGGDPSSLSFFEESDGFKHGGRFTSGQRILVGEEGPEIVSFARGGTVTPTNQIQGMGRDVQIIFNITTPDADSFRQSQGQLMADALRFVQSGQRNT